MPRITLSYRRSDSAAITGRIYDRLALRYGEDSVFMDIDTIPLGVDFREYIGDHLKATDFFLLVIGPQWLGQRSDGTNRIADPNDPVRVEAAAAIRNGLTVLPLLVEGAVMPTPDVLPEELQKISYLNAAEISSGKDFGTHISRVTRFIDTEIERRDEKARKEREEQEQLERQRREEAAAAAEEAARRERERQEQLEVQRRAEAAAAEEAARVEAERRAAAAAAAETERKQREEQQRLEAQRRAEAEAAAKEVARKQREEEKRVEAERRAAAAAAAEAERKQRAERQRLEAQQRAEAEAAAKEAARKQREEEKRVEAERRAAAAAAAAEAARRTREAKVQQPRRISAVLPISVAAVAALAIGGYFAGAQLRVASLRKVAVVTASPSTVPAHTPGVANPHHTARAPVAKPSAIVSAKPSATPTASPSASPKPSETPTAARSASAHPTAKASKATARPLPRLSAAGAVPAKQPAAAAVATEVTSATPNSTPTTAQATPRPSPSAASVALGGKPALPDRLNAVRGKEWTPLGGVDGASLAGLLIGDVICPGTAGGYVSTATVQAFVVNDYKSVVSFELGIQATFGVVWGKRIQLGPGQRTSISITPTDAPIAVAARGCKFAIQKVRFGDDNGPYYPL